MGTYRVVRHGAGNVVDGSAIVIQVTMKEWVMLTFIRTYQMRCGVMPTQMEIAQGCGYKSVGSVARALATLAGKKALTLQHGKGRGIVLHGRKIQVTA